jgi:transposase
MPKPYSIDLRGRVIEEVESGASRREAAERYGLSPSVVVIWMQRFEETGSVAARPSGGSTSPLEKHADILLALIAEQPDLTLERDRGGDAQTKDRWQPQRGVAVLRSAQHQLQKKLCTRRSRSGLQQTQGASAQSGRAHHPAPLASDRSRCYRFQRAGMQQFLSPCRLCSNLTGIRSSTCSSCPRPSAPARHCHRREGME